MKNKFIPVRKKISIVRPLKKIISFFVGFLSLLIFKLTVKNKNSKAEGILLFSFWGLGDSVQQTPLLLGLRRKYRYEKIDVISSPRSYEYLNYLEIFDNVIIDNIPWSKQYESEKYNFFSREYLDFIKFLIKLRKKNYKFAISTRADARDNLLLTLINPKKIVCNSEYFGKYISCVDTNYQRNENKVLYIKDLSKSLQLNFNYRLEVEKKKKSNLIALFVDSNDPSRSFDLELILESITKTEESSNFHVNLITQNPTYEIVNIVKKYKNVKIVQSKSILELINLISESSYYIGTDSGPSHLAGILNIKNLVIFTSGNPYEDAPYNNTTAVYLENFSCRPCAGRCIYKNNFCRTSFKQTHLNRVIKKFISEKSSKTMPVDLFPIIKKD